MFKIFKRRYAPTPIKWKVFGDAILLGCNLDAIRLVADKSTNEYIVVGLLVAGIIGHFLSNLPVDEKAEKKDDAK
jgi:hypothetical protein